MPDLSPEYLDALERIRELEDGHVNLGTQFVPEAVRMAEGWQELRVKLEARIRAADRLAEAVKEARGVIDSLVGMVESVAEMVPQVVPMLNYADGVKARLASSLAAWEAKDG